ncbi:DUF4345 domain-containing protein [Phenylobacterium sp.]|uniref:DUF4345 domain-containing protein n=1 Tax=Phenylobacterium sp. TaxID=1871053 RepID=UPI0025FC5A9C|nr:DUF4345 domain-containing protein [Phenylobacterium sp.]
MRPALERRLLQLAIAAAGLVPVSAGVWGGLGGMHTVGVTADSHARYLSGLLLAIGLIFWWAIPTIERRGAVVRTLTVVVLVGGLARLAGLVHSGAAPAAILPLVMELGVTPLLALWRERVARRIGIGPAS